VSIASLNKIGDVNVSGWVRSVRKQKRIAFIQMYDGSSAKDLQVVVNPELLPALGVGASINVTGKVSFVSFFFRFFSFLCFLAKMKKSEGRGQALELEADKVDVLGACPEDFPLQKKEHSDEFLREHLHLRPRSQVSQFLDF
jgi:asparaginyl-tRNA synthetase